MARRGWLPVGPAMGAAVLLAAALGIWSAERAADALGLGGRGGEGRAPPPASRRAREGSAPGRGPVRDVLAPALTFGAASGGAGLQTKGGAIADASGPAAGAGEIDAPADVEERSPAAALVDQLRRLVRDLEWTPGLPEPPQQTVVPAPEPWRPPPAYPGAASPVIEVVEPGRGLAAGGAQVTIRGRDLRPVNVMFGRAAAQIVSASPAAVVVVAPRGPSGTVAIAVTNEDGSFAIADRGFTYEPVPRAPAQ